VRRDLCLHRLVPTNCPVDVDLGLFNLIIALAISVTKAGLVALFFMHIKGNSRLLRLAATVGVIWLVIMLGLTLSDYFTRGCVPLNH
jgi:cytochrome c oxidase subunit IV